jgi:putative thioredoxin
MQDQQQEQQMVFEVTPQNFQSGVIEQSQSVPVVLLFWADQLPVSVQTRRTMEALVAQYQGKFALALVDVARDPTLAQHLQVQALPSIRVIGDGQLVDQLDGPQGESVLRRMLDRLTMSSGELIRAELGDLIAQKDYRTALRLLQQALAEEPGNPALQVELADVLILAGDAEQGRQVLSSVPEGTPERERPLTRLQLADNVESLPPLASLREQLAADEQNLELRYHCALRQAAAGDYEPALENAMYVLQRDRGFKDDAGRETMVMIFNLLGKGSELAKQYRRRMFNFMH